MNHSQEELRKKMRKRKIAIFDDDPTGSQTVHDIPLFLSYDKNTIKRVIEDPEIEAFFILTNTRAMEQAEAAIINSHLTKIIDEISQESDVEIEIISRGDSTLRGHFPLELDIIRENLTTKINGYVFIPAFIEGGRVTIDDIHYARVAGELLPVNETQFSKDRVFGYKSADLKDYVVEKYQGKLGHDSVKSISLEMLRGESEEALHILMSLENEICIVNCENYNDLDNFVRILLLAEAQGRNYLFRTAASFVKSRIGIKPVPLLDAGKLSIVKERGGLVVVGSYVDMSTKQLERLSMVPGVDRIEIDVDQVISGNDQNSLLNISKRIDKNIMNGVDTVVSTSRGVVYDKANLSFVDIGKIVSNQLSSIVKGLSEKPAFLISKGGITSHDIATKGLDIKKVLVKGQIIDGVTVWVTDENCKFDELVYIVFPGNVGEQNDLRLVYEKLKGIK
jgi:uncharacterized protein YgbK (DUF1537 family)